MQFIGACSDWKAGSVLKDAAWTCTIPTVSVWEATEVRKEKRKV